jgi:DNA-binding HxlR family transcriptional regulator
VKRTPLNDAPCCIARSLDQIGEWWSLLIVRDILLLGHRRFGELLESLGCARNMLSARLKRLVACGILTTAPAADGSAYQEYRLTEKGRDLYLTVIALRQWGERWNKRPDEAMPSLVERETGKHIALELRTEDGRRVGLRDIEVRRNA